MAYRLIQLLIHLIFFWYSIDAVVLNCTVYPVVLQIISDRLDCFIAVANSSNEEVYFDHAFPSNDVQFPFSFTKVISNPNFPDGEYLVQLQIFRLPRQMFDTPLWIAESINHLKRFGTPNQITLRAYNDNPFIAPCIMGVILNTHPSVPDISNNVLNVTVDSMQSVQMNIHTYTPMFPILFMITNIPLDRIQNSTSVAVSIKDANNTIAYQARGQTVIDSDSDCSFMLFHVTQEQRLNLTIILGAHVFTSASLALHGAIIRIYDQNYLIFEQSYLITNPEFPFKIIGEIVPISQSKNYSIEATIYGGVPGYSGGISIFQGVTYRRLGPGIHRAVRISMLYIGPEFGTIIIGTIHQNISNQNTWPLRDSNIAVVVDNQAINDTQAFQFTIFNQAFPFQIVMFDVQKITANNQNIIMAVTITFPDATVIWETLTNTTGILFNKLNKLDFYVVNPNKYQCLVSGNSPCDPTSQNVTKTCCSQYKCANDECTSR